jgi:hypothetical protein
MFMDFFFKQQKMPVKRKHGSKSEFSAELKQLPLVLLNVIREYVYVYFSWLLEDIGEKIDQCLKELPYLDVEVVSFGNYLQVQTHVQQKDINYVLIMLHHMWTDSIAYPFMGNGHSVSSHKDVLFYRWPKGIFEGTRMSEQIIQKLNHFRTFVRNTLEAAKFNWESHGQTLIRYWNFSSSVDVHWSNFWSTIGHMLGVSISCTGMKTVVMQDIL